MSHSQPHIPAFGFLRLPQALAIVPILPKASIFNYQSVLEKASLIIDRLKKALAANTLFKRNRKSCNGKCKRYAKNRHGLKRNTRPIRNKAVRKKKSWKRS